MVWDVGGVIEVVGKVRYTKQSVSGIPVVFGDVGVAGVKEAVLVDINKTGRPVAFGVVEVGVGAVRKETIIRTGGVAVGGPVETIRQ